jgi:hypothetical protein
MMPSSSIAPALARYRLLFLVAAVYDAVLGLAFFFAYEPLFEWLDMPLPPPVSYIQLSAVFVFVQGLSYALVWLDPLGNLGLVRVGIAYKAGYAALAAYYLVTDQIPAMFFAWFGLFDLLFLLAFVWFLRWARRVEPAT